MTLEQVPPRPVAALGGVLRGFDHVGEQDCGEDVITAGTGRTPVMKSSTSSKICSILGVPWERIHAGNSRYRGPASASLENGDGPLGRIDDADGGRRSGRNPNPWRY